MLEWQIFLLLISLELKLETFDPERGAVVITDASISSCASVLMQNKGDEKEDNFVLVDCANKLFSPGDCRKSPIYKELNGLLCALKRDDGNDAKVEVPPFRSHWHQA